MSLTDLATEVAAFVAQNGTNATPCETGVPDLVAFCSTSTTTFEKTLYEPVVCLVLGGRKKARLGAQEIEYGAGDTAIVSHAVPVTAGVTVATPDAPYTALVVRIDLAMLRSLFNEIGDQALAPPPASPFEVAKPDAALVDAVSRLFRLSHDPLEARSLAPLVLREIHFRLLRASNGGMLRQLLRQESPASRVSRAIVEIRERFAEQITIPELASTAGMSQSAFHEHFKTLTSTTPLQYQKELRLLEARRLLTTGAKSVATAAFDVGYESPTQFSREYTRKFGVTPSEDKANALAQGTLTRA
ncbi:MULTISPECIES: AraC family transcriptional regulator [unclassified Roseovarius]|uniref:AraC family transcriptional regulator n=1 Tax=unclassified Roseovarius TaxID=2614913 RepID=UPI00273D4CE3|nr:MULTISPECIES: AraC family transcriptional regulator [unclassified Roseovarius]